MIKNLNPKTKFFLILSAGVLMAAVSASLTIYYVLPFIRTDTAAIMKKKMELADLEAKRDQIKLLGESLKSSENDLNKLKSLIVSRNEPLEFVEAVYASAESSGFEIKSVVYLRKQSAKKEAESTTSDPLIYPLLRVSGGGSESSAKKFVSLIELLPYEVEIRNLTSSKVVSDDDQFTIVFEISVLNQ